MTEINRASPRSVFKKNTPGESRENWQFIKQKSRAWGRLFMLLLMLLLLFPFAAAMYGKGYFDGVQAVRHETISKESKS